MPTRAGCLSWGESGADEQREAETEIWGIQGKTDRKTDRLAQTEAAFFLLTFQALMSLISGPVRVSYFWHQTLLHLN